MLNDLISDTEEKSDTEIAHSHVFQVGRIYGDIWRDGQTASNRPCGKMKPSDLTFLRDSLSLNALNKLIPPERSHFQGREGSGILGHTVEERSLKRCVSMDFLIHQETHVSLSL